MANKKVTDSNNPLVDVHFKISKIEKDFLDNLDESSSGFIRKLIDVQMIGLEPEITKLRAEKRQKEAELNIINAQLEQLETVDRRQQLASQTREELIDKQAAGLLPALRSSGSIVEHKRAIEFRAKAINVQPGEIEQELRKKCEALGVYVRD